MVVDGAAFRAGARASAGLRKKLEPRRRNRINDNPTNPSPSFSSPPTANERTFLAWMSMAVTLGGVSTALVGFTAEEDPRSEF